MGYSLMTARGNEKRKILYPSNITDKKALHLDISYPKISSVVTVWQISSPEKPFQMGRSFISM